MFGTIRGFMNQLMNKRVLKFLVSMGLCSGIASMVFGATVWVMSAENAYVVTAFTADDPDDFGPLSGSASTLGWDSIELWGRCDPAYATGGYKYQWVYQKDSTGDKYAPSTPQSIDVTNYKNLSSGLIDGFEVPTHDSYATYQATLKITHGAVTVAQQNLTVTAVDFTKFTNAYGYVRPPRDRRKVIEQIARGRGLKWLLQHQNADGTWEVFWYDSGSGYQSFEGGTGLALIAYGLYGHSDLNPSNAENDIYFESYDRGLKALANLARELPNTDPEDINHNNTMIRFKETMHATYGADRDLMYSHGISLMALALAYSTETAKNTYTIKVNGNPRRFREVVEDAVDYTASAQKSFSWSADDAPQIGAWGYLPDYLYPIASVPPMKYEPDLSITQWQVLGLAQIEDQSSWRIKAPDSVRARLQTFLRCIQYWNPSDPQLSVYNGAANYFYAYPLNADKSFGLNTAVFSHWPSPEKVAWRKMMVDPDISTYPVTRYYPAPSTVPLPVDPTVADMRDEDNNAHHWENGTAALVQIAYYLAMDTTTANVCGCGATLCNDPTTDYHLDGTAIADSCRRVREAINFLGTDAISIRDRLGIVGLASSAPKPMLYNMYNISKCLRLYQYVQYVDEASTIAGIGNGQLTDGVSTPVTWENEYSNILVKNQAIDGSFTDTDSSYTLSITDRTLDTELSLLILAGSLFKPPAKVILKTDLPRPPVRTANAR